MRRSVAVFSPDGNGPGLPEYRRNVVMGIALRTTNIRLYFARISFPYLMELLLFPLFSAISGDDDDDDDQGDDGFDINDVDDLDDEPEEEREKGEDGDNDMNDI